jgi:hypothetical protein
MADFDYQYPIGFARSIMIEDLLIDYGAAPQSTAPCWMMDVVPFSKTRTGARLFFPNHIGVHDVRVIGRKQGVRLLRLPHPQDYDLRTPGDYDSSRLDRNCTLIASNVQLEKMQPKHPNDTDQVHLRIGGEEAVDYADELALFPEIRFSDCDNVSVYLGNAVASVFFDRCSLNIVNASSLRGELVFRDCRFQPVIQRLEGDLYKLESTLGTRFTNCTIHAPVIAGRADPEAVNRTGFMEINSTIRYYHLNTALGNRVVEHYRNNGRELSPDFIGKLRLHHAMED